MKTVKQPSSIFIHEITADCRHRIVSVKPDGTVIDGNWYDCRQLAELGILRARAPGFSDETLPMGVFTCSTRPYQVL